MNPQKRFVAHFDMLGMRAAVERNPDVAWEALYRLWNEREGALKTKIQIVSSGETIADRVSSFIFSDTVILYTVSNENRDAWAIAVLATTLLGKCLAGCVPMRGGIALGDFYVDSKKGLFMGKPLIEAYDLGEEAKWLGVTVSPAAAAVFQAVPILRGNANPKPAIIEWDVPLKNEKFAKRHIIDWPNVYRKSWPEKPPFTTQRFYEAFENLFGSFNSLEEPVRKKYENTTAFVNKRLLDPN